MHGNDEAYEHPVLPWVYGEAFHYGTGNAVAYFEEICSVNFGAARYVLYHVRPSIKLGRCVHHLDFEIKVAEMVFAPR